MRPHVKVAFAIVFALAFWNVMPSFIMGFREWNSNAVPSWERRNMIDPSQPADPDTWLIHGGVIKAPHLIDTMRWWYGTWAGQVPFYRPLSSMLFWAQWHAFGRHEARYLLVSTPLHLVAVGLFMFMCRDLYRRFRVPASDLAAVFAGLLFVHGLGIFPSRAWICSTVALMWKNLPDSLCAIFMFASVSAYLRNRRWLSLTLFLGGCASKEPAVILPALLVILELPALYGRDTRIAALKRLAPFLAMAPAFLIYRSLCLGTVTGFRFSNNALWSDRLLPGCFGIVSRVVFVHGWMALALGVLAFLFMVTVIQRLPIGRRGAAASTATVLVLMSLISLPYTTDIDAGIGMRVVSGVLMYMDVWREAVAVSIFLTGFWFCLKWPALLVFGWGWALLLTIMLMFTPTGAHHFYLVDAGFAIVLAAGLAQGVTALCLRFPGLSHSVYAHKRVVGSE